MAENISVRCPSCRRQHAFTPPTYPCGCGAPLGVPLLRGGVPMRITVRTLEDSWVRKRCPRCGLSDEWPKPEFTCACGAVVRPAVDSATAMRVLSAPETEPGPASAAADRARRPRFRPLPIHTPHDARQTVVRYLVWLGFSDVHATSGRSPEGIAVRGPKVAAQVETGQELSEPRAVELLWLHALNESVAGVFFSLPGYTAQASERAEQLGLALFTLNSAGLPEPLNEPAHGLLPG